MLKPSDFGPTGGCNLVIPLTADEFDTLVSIMVAGGFRSPEHVIYSAIASKATLMQVHCPTRLFSRSRKELDETPETGT